VEQYGEDSEEARDYAEYLADDLEALNQSKDACKEVAFPPNKKLD
jgi:hypothetical protein